MGFAGELTTIGLPEVFQNVAFNRLTGVMTVREREREAAIYFDDGSIRAFRPPGDRGFDYLDLAARARAVPPEVVQEVARRRRRRKTLRETLRGREGFDEYRFDEAILSAVREELILLFGWRHASFVFEEVRPTNGAFDAEQLEAGIDLDPQAVAVEAARRVDEWETIAHQIESERDIFLPVAALPDDAPPGLLRLVERLDGTCDLRRILEEMPHGRFHVLKMVADLAERGIIVRASADQLRELSAAAEEAGEVNRAVDHLQAALETGGTSVELLKDLVRLQERAGRRNEAGREYKRLARAQEERGDLDGALESYARAAELVPYDIEALERVVGIHDDRGDREEFMRAGLRLAEALSSQRLYEEALEIYGRLLAQEHDSVLLREAVASTYIKLHEPRKAARELLALAQGAWKRGDYDQALHYYRNVLAVDREHEEAAERIEEIEHGRARLRRRALRRRVVAAMMTLLFGLVVWQGAREWEAQKALHESARGALSGIAREPAEESLPAAIETYATVVEKYPWTLGATEATDTVRALLVDSLWRLRRTAASDPESAEQAIERIARVRLPEELRRFWDESRTDLLEEVASRRRG